MARPIVTLGINDGHNAGAALVRDGQVVAAIQEERLVNEKNYSGVPHKSIAEVFRVAQVHPQDTDVVAIVSLNRVYAPLAEMPWKVRLFEQISPLVHSHAWSRFYVRMLHRRRRMDELRQALHGNGLQGKELVFVEHHRAHAATAFYPRPWDERTLVLTADGAGDGLSSTVNLGERFEMERIASSTYYDSIGNSFYSEITAYLGMKRWEHEYKCVAGDTPVLLATGELRTIAELFDQAAAFQRCDATREEITLDASVPVLSLDRGQLRLISSHATKIYRKRARGSLIEVVTESGRRVRTTPNHMFQVLERGVLKEIEAGDLWPGAALGVTSRTPLRGGTAPRDADWGSFFGLHVSEGHEDYRPQKSTDLFYFTNTDRELHDLCGRTCRNLFAKVPRRATYRGVGISRVSLYKDRSRLSAMGNIQTRAGTKRVPSSVMRMGAAGSQSFLRSYFEGDGGVVLNRNGGHFLAATTASEALANDVSYLLLRQGIASRLARYESRATNSSHSRRSGYWRVKVSGTEGLKTFEERVGFVRKYNRSRLREASSYESRTKTDVIPCVDLVRDIYRDNRVPLSKYLTYYHGCRASGRISRKKLKRFLSETKGDDPGLKFLQSLADGDLRWDPVRNVRRVPFDGWVYDLYVPTHHTFVGGFGGMVLHNTMGLAPYGKAELCLETMRSLMRINPRKPLEFQNTSGKCGTRVQKVLTRSLAGQRFDNIAAACQQHFQELMVQWVRNAVAATGLHRVVCAGGLFLNVKANKRLRELPEVEDIFFYPACDDGGTPVGAALEAYFQFCARDGRKPERTPLGPLYYGSTYSDEEIESVLTRRGHKGKGERMDGVDDEIGRLVARSKIVARFAGGTEWGPRALGNRTIIADPRDLRVVKRLNSAIKQRDFWMPFAPSILEERCEEYLVEGRPARYMIEAFDTTERAHELAAALHPQDGTARPQTVNAWNPGYRRVLESFQEETGVGGLLNTSFNLHGYPIVGTPELALWTFENSDLDALALGSWLVSR